MGYTTEDIKNVLKYIADEMIAAKSQLTEIDSKLGDGDMGISMEKGAHALQAEIESNMGSDISRLFMQCAAAFNKAAPSTMGTLISTALMSIAKQCVGKEEITQKDVSGFPKIMAQAISARGKAKLGDKTVLDALIPFADTFENVFSQTGDIKEALRAGADSAHSGMEQTKGMLAKSGRAKWLAERNMEYPDGGAVLCDRVVKRLTADLCQ